MRPFWRLVWKEYREQRSFWLGMFVLALAVSAGFLWIRTPGWPPLLGLIDVGILAAVLYAAGAGAVTFAAEHERGTFAWLRSLPLSASLLGAAKIFWVVASSLLLMGALLICGACFGGQRSVADNESMALRQGCLTLAEASAWAICCSLLLREPLRAAALAISLASLEIHGAVMLVNQRGPTTFMLGNYDRATGWRLLAVALVAALDIWLIPRWLAEKIPPRFADKVRLRWRERGADLRRRGLLPPAWGQWSHLVWQAWRESLPAVALLSVVAAILFVLEARVEWPNNVLPETLLPGLAFLILIVAAWASCCGAFAFRSDQRQHGKRFLAERGISPSLVWLSRQTVWALVLTFWSIVMLVLPVGHFLRIVERSFDGAQTAGQQIYPILLQSLVAPRGLVALLACIPLAYAAGQLVSMFVSSALLAGVLALVLGGLVSGWALLMFVLGINGWWSICPIFAALLAASWLRSRGWLVEREGLAGWHACASVLGLTFGALAVAVPLFRVYQIPAVPRTSLDLLNAPHIAGDTQAGRKTMERYIETWGVVGERSDALARPAHENTQPGDGAPTVPDPFVTSSFANPVTAAEREWVAQCQTDIDDILTASRRDDCYFSQWPGSPSSLEFSSVQGLVQFLIIVGDVRTSDGQLDEAAEAYLGALRVSRHLRTSAIVLAPMIERLALGRLPYWAAHEGQSPGRIRSMIASLRTWRASLPPPWEALRRERQFRLALIEHLDDVASSGDTAIPTGAWIESRLPWERARARRLLDYANKYDVALLTGMTRLLEEGADVTGLVPQLTRGHQREPAGTRIARWAASTPLIGGDVGGLSLAWSAAISESDYRVALSLLALIAWKAEHGELPEQFEPAAIEYLGTVPIDPFSGQPFLYYPAGLPFALPIGVHGGNLTHFFPANTPFLWSVLESSQNVVAVRVTKAPARVPVSPNDHVNQAYYRLIEKSGESDLSIYGALAAGHLNFIP